MLAPRKTLHSTPLRVFTSALDLIDVQPNDVFYDIGCGDGRLVIEAAKRFQIKAVGIEIDEARANEARQNSKDEQVDHLVTILHANAMDVDFSDAVIVFLFLIERGLSLLRPKLEKLPRKCRVVTYLYKFPGDLPYEAKHFLPAKDSAPDVAFPIYLYHFPSSITPKKVDEPEPPINYSIGK